LLLLLLVVVVVVVVVVRGWGQGKCRGGYVRAWLPVTYRGHGGLPPRSGVLPLPIGVRRCRGGLEEKDRGQA
jgi:hypothetical protein